MAAVSSEPRIDIERFLKQNEEKELLRFTTAGSVDDGKSTLIGRLLYDSKGVYEDQLASVRKASVNQTAGPLDFALLTDGLRAEREQGITIDVAYRYFSTPRRKFIIADTPGHEQYTRNMATGASTANLAVVLVDARHGVLPQSRRHAYIASLLGIPHLAVAVNKMDLVDFRQEVFEKIQSEFRAFAAQLHLPEIFFVPISALLGDNVVETSQRMAWFRGPSLLEYLETVPLASDRNLADFRFPVQYVLRPNLDFRGYAGQVASGVVRPGDPVLVLPAGRTSRIKSIVTRDGELPKAFPPMSVALCLEDEIDISRGDMLVAPLNPPHVARRMEATLVWMHEKPLEPGRTYLAKHTTQQVRATVRAIRHRVNVNTLEREPAGELRLNEIGTVLLETHRPLYFDSYRHNRATGALILIDPITNSTVGAAMIADRAARDAAEAGRVTPAERQARAGHRPAVVWLKGSEETAYALERKLFDRGCLVVVLEQAGEIPELARAAADAGLIAICPVDSAAGLERARNLVGADRFLYSDASSANAVCARLEERGIIRRLQDPLTGGAGI